MSRCYSSATILISGFLIFLLFSSFAKAENYYLFVGSYNFSNGKEGIYVYKFDIVTGRLEKTYSTHNIANPSYLTLSPDGKYLYACTETQTKNAGSVSSFKFDSKDGTLAFINKQPSGGENPVYDVVDKSGKWLINANYTEAGISVYALDTNGGIEPPSQVLHFSEGSVNKERQASAHIHSAVFSPAQDFLFFPDLGADKIRCYSFNPNKPKPISEYGATKSVPGSGPRHFAFHPNSKFAYCIEEMAGYITAYRYANGRLDSIQRLAAHSKHRKNNFNSADIHLSPDGRFLYASNRSAENNLAIFSIDQETGFLNFVGYQSTFGDHPRNFTIDPTGRFLIVANQISGNVGVFKRNKKTGFLTNTGVQIKVPGASCLQIRKYND